MTMQYLSQGFLLGLALSPTCLGVCLPLLLPYYSVEARSGSNNVKAFVKFMGGRLLGYIVMGALAGWIGQVLTVRTGHLIWLESTVYIILAMVLIGFAALKSFPHWSFCSILQQQRLSERTPFILGLLTGINICPPFVAVLYDAGHRGGIFAGVQLLIAFFLGTSLILLPIPAVGWFAKEKFIRVAGQFAAGGVGIWFLFKGISLFF